jgi:hypothetical protein
MYDAMHAVACDEVQAVSAALPFKRSCADQATSLNWLSFGPAAVRVSYMLVLVLRRLSTSAAVLDPTYGRELTVISRLVPAIDRLPFERIAPPAALFSASRLVDAANQVRSAAIPSCSYARSCRR